MKQLDFLEILFPRKWVFKEVVNPDGWLIIDYSAAELIKIYK